MKWGNGFSKIHLAFVPLVLLSLGVARGQAIVDQSQTDDEGGAVPIVGFDIAPHQFPQPVGQSVAETFTVGVTGELVQIHVPLIKDDAPFDDPDLNYLILPVIDGAPDENNADAIASGIISQDNVDTLEYPFPPGTDNWTALNFTSPASVTAGEKLAIELTDTGGDNPDEFYVVGSSSSTNPYAAGDLFVRDSTSTTIGDGATWQLGGGYLSDSGGAADIAFQTYVIPSANLVVPEPSTYALMLGGIAVLFFLRRRRRASQTR